MMTVTRKNLAVLTAVVFGLAAVARADDQDLAKEVKDLQKRVAELEGNAATSGGTNDASKTLSWLSDNHISGFASASYLYNFNRVDAQGRSFDVNHNEFTVNKFKLAFERPIDYSATNWNAGYRADVIFGQDAQLIHSAGLNTGDYVDLEQLYVNVNVPIGNGLQVSVGKWVTLMGVEVIEETVNPNWSEGNQFLFVENFTGTGIQLSYKWTDKIDTQFRLYNGWDVTKDNNDSLSYMGRIGYAPDDKTSIGVVGYGGPEEPNNSRDWRYGVNVVVSRKVTDKLTVWGQGDYGREENFVAPGKDAKWWAGGLWASYDLCEHAGVALRGDYFNDRDGARTSGVLGLASNTGQEMESLTLTLNIKPIKNLQVRPELRWDHSSAHLFSDDKGNGKQDQVTIGMGVAYLF